MSVSGAQAWKWRPAQSALAPQAAIGRGEVARGLLQRLRGMPVDDLARLRITASMDWVIVVGTGERLPWVAEVAYAAPHPQAPELWVPTLWLPDVPADLLARALIRQFQRQPLLLWRDPAVVVPLDRVLPASPEVLARIAAHRQEG